jgi:catechol 2,3-dioxygenase-like lactoylglutathione lyase family enzyme
MITHLNTVSLYVSDQEKARRFYVDLLGFEVRREADMGPMGTWLEVAPPGARTGLMLADASRFGKQDRIGNSADLVLHTDDVAGLHRKLVAAGISVTDPETQQWGTFVKVTDPDGHAFVVSQPGQS